MKAMNTWTKVVFVVDFDPQGAFGGPTRAAALASVRFAVCSAGSLRAVVTAILALFYLIKTIPQMRQPVRSG